MNNSLASLVCNLCLKTFSTKGNLKMHYMVHTGVKPFICEICKKGFTQKGNLKAHLQRHMDNKQLDHDFCNEVLSHERHMIEQYKSQPEQKPQICQECHKVFNSEMSLCEHILATHVRNVPKQGVDYPHCSADNSAKTEGTDGHVCNICKEHVSTTSALELHLFVHKTLKPYTSYQSNEIYTENAVQEACRKVNMDVDDDSDDDDSTSNEASMPPLSIPFSGIKPYACQICGKRYYNELSLKIHYKTHMHPYVCKICQKSFPHRCNLELHELAHAKHKPHVCTVCEKGFAQKSQFENHFRKHSGEWKPFSCEICNKSYTSKYYLRTHLERHKLGLIPVENEQSRIQIMSSQPPT